MQLTGINQLILEFRFSNSSENLVSCSCARSRSCALELFQPFWKDACLNKETHSLYVLGNWMDYLEIGWTTAMHFDV